jgi:hypothetical protein
MPLSRSAGLLLALALALLPGAIGATPFELIVPGEVNVNGSGGTGISFTAWGWISPAAGTLSDADLNAAIATATLSDPNVGIGTPTSVALDPFALAPGEFAGFLANFPTTDNAVFLDELAPGESLGPLWRYTIGFSFPSTSYSGGGVLDATLSIGGHVASWSAQVNFVTTGKRFEALSAQRIASVPEPATLPLVGLGAIGLAIARRSSRRGSGSSRR